ncbi:uncharacterized protein [Panulirus ornatus]|uniref:uncharacterized protein isoform X5 n=1 Tax=Panulirus ornatus TaxID=150431 RepID=UPI003A89FA70
MEEGGTVNGIDPSNLHVMLAEVEEIIIAEEINFTSPLHISGDVTAVNVNNLVLEGLDDCYWRRSAYQDITIPVQLQSAVIEGPVVGETLNGYPLSEYLHKTGQASVFGNNIFEVNGHSLDCITREFLLDGVDQNVRESWRANYMEVDVFTTRGSPIAGTISGVLTSFRWMRGN